MLLLTEQDVRDLFPMETALECVEASFIAQARRDAVVHPRQRIFLNDVSLHYMAAALPGEKLLGMKIYTVSRRKLRFVVLLYDGAQGELVAMIEADQLGRIRTGAASGVATRYLARPDAARIAVIGAGRQACTQLHAITLVRRLAGAQVYCRDAQRRAVFCREMGEMLHLRVEPAESAEAAIRSSDIVVTATSARNPVFEGDWLRPGSHVNAIGANVANHREVDDATLTKASLITVDFLEQAKIEAGDLIQGFQNSPSRWESVCELKDIVTGTHPGRRSAEDITLFKSSGIALWDVAAAGVVYRRAKEAERGKEIRLSEALP